jgi:hypothetical protein
MLRPLVFVFLTHAFPQNGGLKMGQNVEFTWHQEIFPFLVKTPTAFLVAILFCETAHPIWARKRS